MKQKQIQKVIVINTPYDDVFRTMVNDCARLLIPLINLLFEKDYDINDPIEIHHNEYFIHTKSGDEEKRITDSFFTINGEMYILECQSTADNTIIIRIIEYAFHGALETATLISNNRLEMTFPRTAVLYLRSDDKTPEKMECVIHFPEGDFQTQIPVIKINDYTLEDLFDKKLYFLIPFYAFNHEKDFEIYNNDSAKLEELKQEYKEILYKLEQAKSSGDLYQINVRTIQDMSKKVVDNLAAKYKNIKKGVASIMGGRILDYEGKKIFNEGNARGINQTNKRVATDMIKRHLPISLISEISQLSEDVIYSIAKSIGISIVK